jgi:hypothetical protein
MKTLRIFVASSSELIDDREKFELFIGRRNNLLSKKGIRLEVVLWEFFQDSISSTRLQDEYNEAIRKSDFVVCLFFTKVGMYTAEEFNIAYEIFKAQGKPRIWTYFKSVPVDQGSIVEADIKSLFEFKKKLKDLGHFFTQYTSTEDLLMQYGSQLDFIMHEYEGNSDPQTSSSGNAEIEKQAPEIIENTFNQVLTPRLINAISQYNKKAASFLAANPDWSEREELVKLAKRLIISEYVGVIGSQIRKLMAIGALTFSRTKMLQYLENCQFAAKRSLQLICYALISTLWDHQLASKKEFTAAQKEVLAKFFRNAAEEDILAYAELLKHLLEIFSENKLEFLISEARDLFPKLQDGSDFLSACHKLNDLSTVIKNSTFQLGDCEEAEQAVTLVLEELSFLAQYRMISINEIDYNQQRNDQKGLYLHNYTLLVGEKTTNSESQSNVRHESSPVISHAVIIFKDNYRKNINLDPFIIDINGLKLEGGSKICFYSHANTFEDKDLNYSFIEDNRRQSVSETSNPKPDGTKLNELNTWLSKKANRIDMNLDKVYCLFFEAKKVLTGIEEQVEEDSF